MWAFYSEVAFGKLLKLSEPQFTPLENQVAVKIK